MFNHYEGPFCMPLTIMPNERNHFFRRFRREPCRGLVEKVELLGAEEDHREGEGLALSAGEGTGADVELGLEEVEEIEHLGAGGGVDVAGERETGEGEVLVDGLTREDIVRLAKIANAREDPLLGGERGDRTALKPDVAASEREHADDGLEERRLAAAVRSSDEYGLPFLDRKIHVVKHRPVAVTAGKMFDGKEFAHESLPIFSRGFFVGIVND